MALVVCLYDADPARRQTTMARIEAESLPYQEELTAKKWDHGPWSVLYRTAVTVPVAEHKTPEGYASIIGRLLDSGHLPQKPETSPRHPIGGFGARLAIDTTTHQLDADTDFLGIFPLYFGAGNDWMMITSSPWMFRCHPDFIPEWSLEGIAGILQTMHLVDQQTVWRGVRRLAAGHHLRWTPNQPFDIRPAYQLPGDPPAQSGDPDQIYDLMTRALKAWIPDNHPRNVMLSGGLDSRLLAGMLTRIPGPRPSALTEGVDRDVEIQCARLVARELNMKHQVWEFSHDDLFHSLTWTARLELASNGMNTSLAYLFPGRLPHPSAIITGFALDAVMNSPLHHHGSFSSSAQSVVDYYGSWGFSREALATLRPDPAWRNALDGVQEHLRRQLTDCPAQPLYRAAQRFEIYGRQRHHVGGMGWRLAWRAWPVMSAYDAPTILHLWGTADDLRQNRELEREMLRCHSPALARIPLDNNSPHPVTLSPSRWWHLIGRRVRGQPSLKIAAVTSADQLRYYRIFNINAPHWRNIRERVEPLRHTLDGLFDPAALNNLFPGPDADIPMQNVISESSGRKTLIGLMLLADAMRRR